MEMGGLPMEVYIDLLFLVNFLLNTWALWLTSLLAGQLSNWRRLALAAALGAIYGLGMVTPWAAYFSHPLAKLLLAATMVQIAHNPRVMLRLLQLSGLFLLVSFATAGCALGVQALLTAQGGISGGTLSYGQLPFWVLLIAALMLAIGSRRVINLLENRLVHVANRARIDLALEGGQVTLDGLIDSGNQLTDPFGGRPVMVVALAAVAHLLPEEVVALALSDQVSDACLNTLDGQAWLARVRFIPYHSVGRKSGVLLGWRVDQATIATDQGMRTVENVIMALSGHALSEQGAYQALIPQRLLPAVTRSTEEVL